MTIDDLSDDEMSVYIDRAQTFLNKQGWTYNDFDYAEVVYKTVLYLHSVEKLVNQPIQYPCYAVHCVEDDSRFESASYGVALSRYKKICRDGKRAAMFLWKSRNEQEKIYASQDYPYSRDYVS